LSEEKAKDTHWGLREKNWDNNTIFYNNQNIKDTKRQQVEKLYP
jgi:hypothetical protein